MPKKNGNISLSSYDDIFQTDQSREEAQQERVQEIPLSELHPFKGPPFKVLDDDAMQKTVESIAQFGVMTPAIARPRPEGGYELIAGHRRRHRHRPVPDHRQHQRDRQQLRPQHADRDADLSDPHCVSPAQRAHPGGRRLLEPAGAPRPLPGTGLNLQ